MQKVRDRIIVLRIIKHGESDLIVHSLSSQVGRLNFIAKGALRSKKRFGGGVLEPTHFIEVMYKRKDEQIDAPLHFLEEATLLNGFESLRVNYERLQTAFYLMQLVSKVSQENDWYGQELFNLTGNTLRALQTSEQPELLKTHFEMKLLACQGVLPHDLPENDLYNLSISDHAKSRMPKMTFGLLQNRVHHAIKSYLDS
jgi:DNA repair protein RecO (recombination protein O)